MNWLVQWSFDPSVIIGLVIAALLYARGWRPLAAVADNRRSSLRPWQVACFYAGLVVIFIALESPIDALSAKLFSFHMIQHLLLIMLAAPLVLLGDPAVTLVRGIPLHTRRSLLGALAHRSWVRSLLRGLRFLGRPQAVFVIFLVDLYFWHWAWLFNLTLQNNAVHLLEHACFLVTAVLFWAQVIDQRGMKLHLSYAYRSVYTLLTAAFSNLLAMYFVFTPKPLYDYAHVAGRPFGMTALGDQQIAGAIMWIPVLFLFGGAFAVLFYKLLSESEVEGAAYTLGTTPYSMFPTGGDIKPAPVRGSAPKV